MKYKGTVHGKAALKYPDFVYVVPVKQHVDIWSLDPERFNAHDPYPRSTNPPGLIPLQTQELVDYEVKSSSIENNGKCNIQVWLLPNEYTLSNNTRLVFEFEVRLDMVYNKDVYDYAVEHCFMNDHMEYFS